VCILLCFCSAGALCNFIRTLSCCRASGKAGPQTHASNAPSHGGCDGCLRGLCVCARQMCRCSAERCESQNRRQSLGIICSIAGGNSRTLPVYGQPGIHLQWPAWNQPMVSLTASIAILRPQLPLFCSRKPFVAEPHPSPLSCVSLCLQAAIHRLHRTPQDKLVFPCRNAVSHPTSLCRTTLPNAGAARFRCQELGKPVNFDSLHSGHRACR
jgi:hypothetical protein